MGGLKRSLSGGLSLDQTGSLDPYLLRTLSNPRRRSSCRSKSSKLGARIRTEFRRYRLGSEDRDPKPIDGSINSGVGGSFRSFPFYAFLVILRARRLGNDFSLDRIISEGFPSRISALISPSMCFFSPTDNGGCSSCRFQPLKSPLVR